MRGDQLVDQAPNLIEVELGRSVRVHHRGVVDVFAVLGHEGADGELLDIDVGADQRGQLRRERAHSSRMNARRIHEAGDFHGAIVGQRGNAAVVALIAVDYRGLAGPDGIDDGGGIFATRPDLDLFLAAVGLRQAFPPLDLLDAAFRVLVERNAEFLDQVLAAPLDEPGRVFREMLGALGDEIAEPRKHLVPHLVGAARVGLGLRQPALAIALEEFWIEVAIAPVALSLLELEVEGHVIYARRAIADLAERNVEIVRELHRRALDGMAEADWRIAGCRAEIAHALIAIGLTCCNRIASGQTASMSSQTDQRCGTVRRPRMMPPTPSVSAIVCLRPKRLGTSKSVIVQGA